MTGQAGRQGRVADDVANVVVVPSDGVHLRGGSKRIFRHLGPQCSQEGGRGPAGRQQVRDVIHSAPHGDPRVVPAVVAAHLGSREALQSVAHGLERRLRVRGRGAASYHERTLIETNVVTGDGAKVRCHLTDSTESTSCSRDDDCEPIVVGRQGQGCVVTTGA